jgi:hypothetical protein
MSIALDVSTTVEGVNVSNVTVSHTCTGTSIDAIMFIAISAPTGTTKFDQWKVKYGTTAAKFYDVIGQSVNLNQLAIFYIHNPPAGTANVDVTTFGEDLERFRVIAVSLTGVSENFFIEEFATAAGDGAVVGDPANSVTTERDNSWVLSFVTHDDQTTAMTVPSGHTQLQEGNVGSGSSQGRMSGAYFVKTTAGAETCNYTASATTGFWSHIAISVREASPRMTVTGLNTLTFA